MVSNGGTSPLAVTPLGGVFYIYPIIFHLGFISTNKTRPCLSSSTVTFTKKGEGCGGGVTLRIRALAMERFSELGASNVNSRKEQNVVKRGGGHHVLSLPDFKVEGGGGVPWPPAPTPMPGLVAYIF